MNFKIIYISNGQKKEKKKRKKKAKRFDAGKENWGIIPQWHLNKIAKDKEWSYINCNPNDITYIELIQNGFWQEVVATYSDNIKAEQVNPTNFKTLSVATLYGLKENCFVCKMAK